MKKNVLRLAPAATAAAPPAVAPPARERNALDMFLQSRVAAVTGGISPIAMNLAFLDWWQHLALSPGKRSELAISAVAAMLAPAMGDAQTQDLRFADSAWAQWPFNCYAYRFKQLEQFWQRATEGVPGVSPHHADVVAFTARQLLDMWSPSNFPLTNPEVLRAAAESGGRSLLDGARNWGNDLCRRLAPPAATVANPVGSPYVPGREVALTPGQVVFRNELIELIQYTPQTATVYREPVLIVPSWIMKYYILDLSPHNSLVSYLVQAGHTVLMVSWRNPGPEDRDLGMDEYLRRGLLAALDETRSRCGGVPVHAVGYCLGGTLLSIAAAALATQGGRGHEALASLTLLAAQTDFSEPGELGLFIDDSELAFLDALMWDQGYLAGDQMAATFQLLNARDLVWSRQMREYLLGQRTKPNDLMAWNADSTRLPFRMHSEYLHGLLLHNDLADGRYMVDGRPVVLADIRQPMYVLATERDHVSPWRSVYKIHLLCHAGIDFILTAGGHNAGVVSPPGHPRRSYRSASQKRTPAEYCAPQTWYEQADYTEGSWWPHWQQWLVHHSAQQRVTPPPVDMARALGSAPGCYVMQP